MRFIFAAEINVPFVQDGIESLRNPQSNIHAGYEVMLYCQYSQHAYSWESYLMNVNAIEYCTYRHMDRFIAVYSDMWIADISYKKAMVTNSI